MASHLIDSAIFKDLFGTEQMRRIFSDEALVERWLEVEVALARAEAKLGIIPESAAAEIARQSVLSNIDIEVLKRETELVGYPILPLVHQITQACTGDTGEFLHWGATTQDIMDTAVVLQIKEALTVIEKDLIALEDTLVDLALRHRGTPMPGRTHGQHALPITFGYKVAIWLSEIHRHVQRLLQIRTRALVGQFGGAVGTLASLGESGLEVQEILMRELGLQQPTVAWHVSRDRFAEIVFFLSLITATLGKIALEVATLMKTEVAELGEPFVEGRGSSSTMPQKRNPISCEMIIAAATVARQHTPLALDAMQQEHERGTGPWQVEWMFLPEAFVLAAGAMHQTQHILTGLEVNTGQMRRNLEMTRGLIVAEAVMMALAPHIGRQRAHDFVYRACLQASEQGCSLLQVLQETPGVQEHIPNNELEKLLDPARCIGLAEVFVDRVVAEVRAERSVPVENNRSY